MSNKALNDVEFLTVQETAQFLHISVQHLYNMMHKRVITYYKPGGKIAYFSKADLLDYLFKCRVTSNGELERRAEEIMNR